MASNRLGGSSVKIKETEDTLCIAQLYLLCRYQLLKVITDVISDPRKEFIFVISKGKRQNAHHGRETAQSWL